MSSPEISLLYRSEISSEHLVMSILSKLRARISAGRTQSAPSAPPRLLAPRTTNKPWVDDVIRKMKRNQRNHMMTPPPPPPPPPARHQHAISTRDAIDSLTLSQQQMDNIVDAMDKLVAMGREAECAVIADLYRRIRAAHGSLTMLDDKAVYFYCPYIPSLPMGTPENWIE